MTMTHPDVPDKLRGTFLGMCSEPIIEHLTKLGISAIELLPIQSFVDDRYLLEKDLRNYWGYQTLGFFAPQGRYMSSDQITEIKTMVRRFHAAGIEVIMDVVYNHTAEGSERGPTLSFRGLDNQSYYRLSPDDQRHTFDTTGTGNTLNVAHPMVLRMVLDSLRYWVGVMHIDGFRFDLASTLGREEMDFDRQGGFFDAIPPGSGPRGRQADRRTLGYRRGAATRSAASPIPSANGTTSIATRCAASGRATAARWQSLPPASPARRGSSTIRIAAPRPPSTCSAPMTASR